ncbi:MAG: SagB/ThcOx family dehydrogenase [Bryobacteraceae bacterium]|jgi:SagB-type dehydrogenase family enzyme
MPESQAVTVRLPAPRTKGTLSIEEAIAARRSQRAYRSDPLTLAEAAQLLWSAQGITGPERQRTAPSAGALFPLELYLCVSRVEGLEPGTYRYHPRPHELVLVSPGDKRRELAAAALDQDCIRFSSCILLFAAVPERITVKYGQRGLRYIHMEAGHAAENVYLQATALGLGTVVVGAFDDAQLARIAHLAAGEEAVYMMPVGKR